MAKNEKLKIKVTPQPRPKPQTLPLKQVRKLAKEAGHANADTLDIAGVTLPKIRVDQTGLNYEQRRTPTGIEFRFLKGELKITAWQNILMSDHIGACERKIWIKHEMDHVRDNERIFRKLAAKFRADSYMKSVFEKRQWLPRDSFDLIQASTQETCFGIFTKLVAKAVRKRDTASEYRHVRKRVRNVCGKKVTKRPVRRAGE